MTAIIGTFQRIFSSIYRSVILTPNNEKNNMKLFVERVKVKKHTYGLSVNNIVFFDGRYNGITIGKYCSIGPGVTLFSGGEHNYGKVSTFPFKKQFGLSLDNVDAQTKGDIVVMNDVWIGSGALILSGVTIGNGAVIGARTVVSKDVPDYAIAIGNPMQILKYRFTVKQIDSLLKIKWWDWDDEKIMGNIDYFYGDVDNFIEKFST